MDDLAFLRSSIPDYADYSDVDRRRQVDKQIRARLGEALSDVRERLRPAGALAERLDGLILRCEFADQRVIRAADHASFDAALADRIHQLDRRLVESAERLGSLAVPGDVSAELDTAARLLDERFGAIADAPTP